MKSARRKPKPAAVREFVALLESAAGSSFKADRAAGIIYGVKVLGQFSPNSHGVEGAEQGTEYTRAAMESELPMLEGARAKKNHPPRDNPNAERSVDDTFGVFRKARIEERNELAIVADLHLNMEKETARSVMYDAEKQIGEYSFSHNARWKQADVKGGRLVITAIESVASVDLVDKGATTSTLWESRENKTVKYTIKSCLESRLSKWPKGRQSWARRILEMGGYEEPIQAETDDMPVDADPADAMKAAFRSAGDQILDGIFDGSIDETVGLKKLKELLKTHGKLSQTEEPEEPAVTEGDDEDDEKKKKDKDKETTESLRAEVAALKRDKTVRDLCEADEFKPTKTQFKALTLLESDTERKTLIRESKPGHSGGRPVSGGAGGGSQGGVGGVPQTAEGQLAFLRRG